MNFRFELGARVAIVPDGECGTLVARAEWLNSPPQYLVRFLEADGRVAERWMTEHSIVDN